MKNATKAFRRGFATGFSAPYRLMYAGRKGYAYQPRDFVTLSWSEVGQAVRAAVSEEKLNVGKTAKSSSGRHS